MRKADEPNIRLPLAFSYDTRKNASTQAQAGVDQRKVNFMYDNVQNPIAQTITVELMKRPGIGSFASSGTNGENGYLVVRVGAPSSSTYWNINVSGGNIRASNGSDNTIVTSSSGAQLPAYITLTNISGTVYAVLQVRVNTSDTAQLVYYASAINSWTQITDGDFTGLVHRGQAVHLDGYMFIMDSLNRVYQSDLNSLANWTAGNYFTKQIEQDTPAGCAKFKNQILMFGDNTCEVGYNAGNASGSVLASIPQLQSRVGLSAIHGAYTTGSVAYKTHYYCVIGDYLYFVGHAAGDAGGIGYGGGLWTWDGSRMEQISSPQIDRMMSEQAGGLFSVNAMTIFGQDAVAIGFTGPTSSAPYWLMYFPSSKSWFEWTSTVFSPVNWEGVHQHAQGASLSGVYYFNSENQWQDNSAAYTATLQLAIPQKSPGFNHMRWCAVNGDTTSSTSALNVSFSDNDYSSFQTARAIDLSSDDKRLWSCGQYKTRKVKMTHAANTDCRIREFMARVD